MTAVSDDNWTTLGVDPDSARMRALVEDQRRAFLAEGPPSAAVRRNRIDRLTAAVLEHVDDLVAALDADFGNRPAHVSLRNDVLGALSEVELIRDRLEEWMADRPVPGSAEQGMPSFVQSRPKGVVGVVGPWNFPVTLVVRPAVEALAAGNRVVIKFSEVPARTAEVFARAVAEQFSPDEVVVVRGGRETSAAFSELPFDHLFFTGSPAVGRHVAVAAGRNLVPVTLELGGKNPVVIGHDADPATAAERISAARMMNGGQLCLCPDYVFVPRERIDEFVAAYRTWMATYFPRYLHNPDAVTIIDERNYERIVGLVDDARAKGAEVITIAPEEELDSLPDAGSRRIPPTLLLGVTEEMSISNEEVFGPVISVYPYDDVQEPIAYISSKPHPLAAYWYGEDGAEFREFVRSTTSGGLTRNDWALHYLVEGAPFGGVGQSGTGAYHGQVGFDALSHQRTITQNQLPTGFAPQSMPPFSPERVEATRQAVADKLAAVRERLGDA